MKKFLLLTAVVLSVITLSANEQTEIFNRTTKYLDKGGILFQFHNTQDLGRQFETLLQFSAQNSQTANLQLGIEFFKQFSKALDLDALQGVGASVKDLTAVTADSRKAFALYQNKSFVAIDPKSSGSVFAVVRNANGRFPAAANLPLNTIFATGIKLNWSNAYRNIEKTVNTKNSSLNIIAMIEQNLGVRMPALMQNISGDYFFAIYKGKTPDSFHFLAQIPDNNSVLKKIAQQRMAPLLKIYKDKSASFELPLPAGKFGAAYTVLFAQNRVFIYNSNAPLNSLLNTRRQEKLLTSLSPDIFGMLNRCDGNSYTVLNLNLKDIDPAMISKQYLACNIGTMKSDGYLQSGKSNFKVFDFTEYMPIIDLLKKMNSTAAEPPIAQPLQ